MRQTTMNMWRIKLVTFASLFVFLFPAALHAQTYAWEIEGFQSIITVREDGMIHVKETIDAQFHLPKHGIYRNIPIAYRDKLGNRLWADIDVGEVLVDGEPARAKVTRFAGELKIRIGDPDVTITGAHTYVIEYEMERALLFLDEFDELYWNVTGDEWDTPMRNVEAVVILPDGVEVRQTACYTGRYGSTEGDCGMAVDGNRAAFASDDFLTVAVAFDKGVVAPPTTMDRIRWFFKDHWPSMIPIAIIIGIVSLWWRLGRDPKMKSVIVEYEPPEGLWAVYAGIMTRTIFTSADTTAMIVQMAVKGYLKFHVEDNKKEKTRLEKLKEGEGLDSAHRYLFDEVLFRNRKEVKISQLEKTGATKRLNELKKRIFAEFEKKHIYTSHSFRWRSVLLVVAFILAYVTFASPVFFGMLTAILFALATITTFAFAWLMPKKTLHGTEVARKVKGFKEFMHTAERYRSQWHEKEGMFEEYLPYAIAFGHTKEWAAAFADSMYEKPDWYDSNMSLLTTSVFVTDILKTAHSVSSATVPRSSGSSGGGFSGGGMGGGGGGSW